MPNKDFQVLSVHGQVIFDTDDIRDNTYIDFAL